MVDNDIIPSIWKAWCRTSSLSSPASSSWRGILSITSALSHSWFSALQVHHKLIDVKELKRNVMICDVVLVPQLSKGFLKSKAHRSHCLKIWTGRKNINYSVSQSILLIEPPTDGVLSILALFCCSSSLLPGGCSGVHPRCNLKHLSIYVLRYSGTSFVWLSDQSLVAPSVDQHFILGELDDRFPVQP